MAPAHQLGMPGSGQGATKGSCHDQGCSEGESACSLAASARKRAGKSLLVGHTKPLSRGKSTCRQEPRCCSSSVRRGLPVRSGMALQSSCAASHCPAAGEVGAVQLWCRVPPLGSRLRTTPKTRTCCFHTRVSKIPVAPSEGQTGGVSCSPEASSAPRSPLQPRWLRGR